MKDERGTDHHKDSKGEDTHKSTGLERGMPRRMQKIDETIEKT